MSVTATTWVWDHAEVDGGSELLVLLALADEAGSDGRNAFPGVKTLASRSRISERQVQRILRTLQSKNVIVQDGVGPAPYHTNRYTIVGMQGGDNLSGVTSTGHRPDMDATSTGHLDVTQPVPVPEPLVTEDSYESSRVNDDATTFSDEKGFDGCDCIERGCDLFHFDDDAVPHKQPCEDRNRQPMTPCTERPQLSLVA